LSRGRDAQFSDTGDSKIVDYLVDHTRRLSKASNSQLPMVSQAIFVDDNQWRYRKKYLGEGLAFHHLGGNNG